MKAAHVHEPVDDNVNDNDVNVVALVLMDVGGFHSLLMKTNSP
jgi:hypothetical protein